MLPLKKIKDESLLVGSVLKLLLSIQKVTGDNEGAPKFSLHSHWTERTGQKLNQLYSNELKKISYKKSITLDIQPNDVIAFWKTVKHTNTMNTTGQSTNMAWAEFHIVQREDNNEKKQSISDGQTMPSVENFEKYSENMEFLSNSEELMKWKQKTRNQQSIDQQLSKITRKTFKFGNLFTMTTTPFKKNKFYLD